MVGAVLAGDGLERVAEIAAARAGAPVAVIVPRLGVPLERWGRHERYVAARLAGGRPPRPDDVVAEVPIASGGRELGAVLLLGRGRPDAADYLHMAAIAALTEVAVAEARDETEQSLRGSFLEEVLSRPELEPTEVERRARRLGCDLDAGYVALCATPNGRGPGRVTASILAEVPGALAQSVEGKVYALLPGDPELARRAAARLGRHALVGVSSHRSGGAELRRALEEAELVLGVTAAGGGPPGEEIGEGTYRLLFRVLASHPQEVRSFYEDTVAALVRYDEQYSSDLVGTLSAYLENNCNMAATAQAIHAHRHTVGYRLERVKELSGLDPLKSEDRERLGLGLKAYRIIAPSLPR
jgi:PucR C-terminal helix-turn-helix domain/GGDEF-like domain